MEHITIDIPGAYHASFEGSGVIQHQGDLAMCGYPGAPALYKAWTESSIVRRGKGYAIRLTVPVADAVEALACVIHLAETTIDTNRDAMSGLDSRWSRQDREERFEYLSEIGACQRLVERSRKARLSLTSRA